MQISKWVKYPLLTVGVASIGLSASYNVMFWTGEARNDIEWWSFLSLNIISDALKPFMVWYAYRLWRAGQIGLSLGAVSIAALSVSLSFSSAFGYRAKSEAELHALVAKAETHRTQVEEKYHAAKALLLNKPVKPAIIRAQLDRAKTQVTKQKWASTLKCTNATVASSKAACADVIRFRSELEQAEKDWPAYEAAKKAETAFLALPKKAQPVFSPFVKSALFWAMALLLELSSALVVNIAMADLTPKQAKPKRKPGHEKPKEMNWIDAMKQAAMDPDVSGVHFDENGMLQAPLSKLAKVLDVKSTSTASDRVRALEKAGLLERSGAGKNLRYRVLEEA